jgi:hypothetical protein
MVGPATCFQDYDVDYIVQKRKKKDLVAYTGGDPATSDIEPSYILVMFPLVLL